MKVLIVEDETVAYENLQAMLHEVDPTIEVVGNTESIRQTVLWMQNHPAPELILMDIHLSDGSAFSIFDIINIHTPIIFTTAYDEHAIDAFKVNSIDYLLKPIKPEDLKRALDKFRKWTTGDLNAYLKHMLELAPQKSYSDKILVPMNDQLILVKMKDVACFYTSDKNTIIYLNNGQTYPISKSLDQIYNTLNPSDFIRANKQFIVARESVQKITIWFDNRLLIELNIEVPEKLFISKNKAAEFKNWMVTNS